MSMNGTPCIMVGAKAGTKSATASFMANGILNGNYGSKVIADLYNITKAAIIFQQKSTIAYEYA